MEKTLCHTALFLLSLFRGHGCLLDPSSSLSVGSLAEEASRELKPYIYSGSIGTLSVRVTPWSPCHTLFTSHPRHHIPIVQRRKPSLRETKPVCLAQVCWKATEVLEDRVTFQALSWAFLLPLHLENRSKGSGVWWKRPLPGEQQGQQGHTWENGTTEERKRRPSVSRA